MAAGGSRPIRILRRLIMWSKRMKRLRLALRLRSPLPNGPGSVLILALISPMVLFGQKLPDLNDGEAHGDAPYLLEDGWRPLLNGRDLGGWHGRDEKPFEWFTTRGVRWDRLLGPTRLSASVREPSGTIMNGPQGGATDLVSGEEFGDMELYLEFLIPKGS